MQYFSYLKKDEVVKCFVVRFLGNKKQKNTTYNYADLDNG